MESTSSAAVWPLLLALSALLLQPASAIDFRPVELDLSSLTCDGLWRATELDGCRFATVGNEQQIVCKMLNSEVLKDPIVSSYGKAMLNTLSFRLLDSTGEDNVFCASLASVHIAIWKGELKENHTVGELPGTFLSFLSFFSDDSFAHIDFTKRVPIAKAYINPECHDLISKKALRDDCMKYFKFIRVVSWGKHKSNFVNVDYWNSLKRQYVRDLGGEMTQFSVASSGQLFAVPLQFVTEIITEDLRMKEFSVANIKMGDIQRPLLNMPTLRILRLRDAGITKLTKEALQGTPGVLELDLSGNRLEELPPSLPASLESLNVSRNQLSSLPSALPASLVTLNVSHNQFEDLPASLPASLQTLDASHNSLLWLPRELPAGLRVLVVSHNLLRTLPGNLPPSLHKLQVSHNELQTLSAELVAPLQQLQVLDASHNQLSTTGDLRLSHQMQLLNVSHNQLRHIRLVGPGNVTKLDASHNRIETWQVRAREVFLAGNNRSALGLGQIATDAAMLIDLGDNLLLNCDPCSADRDVTLQLRRWMINQQSNSSQRGARVVRPATPVCADPQELAGRPLVEAEELEDASDCPGSPRYVAKIALPAIAVLALIAGVVVLAYYHRYQITYVLHLMKMRRERLAAEKRDPSTYKYDAFVCYSKADRAWVVGQLLPTMETAGDSPDDPALRLCLHERDFPLGSFITENILSSMKNSRSTLVIVSEGFVTSQWCRWELELASNKVPQLVLLELERLERSRLPRNLRYLMDTRTYLEWPAQPRAQEAKWKQLRAVLRDNKSVPSSAVEAESQAQQAVP